MTHGQSDALNRLIERLRYAPPIEADTNDGLFLRVRGVIDVTVIIGTRGAYKVPALRHYDPELETAVNAPKLFGEQKRADDADPVMARQHTSGHISPIVGTDLKCGDVRCRCQKEDPKRRRDRSLKG